MEMIKFRIYDPERKKMIESGATPMMLSSFFENTATLDTVHKMEYQQFTGLLDRLGKEIYEGDIIGKEGVFHFNERVSDGKVWEPSSGNWARLEKKRKNFTGKEEENYISGHELEVVEWKNKSCGFEPFSDSNDNCGHCGGGADPKIFEVIGNIYENKDLLTP